MKENEITSLLSELGFTKRCIVETIVVTRSQDKTLKASPMGVIRTADDMIEIRPYKTSLTYENLKRNIFSTINVTTSPMLFMATAFKEEIEYQPFIKEEMVIDGADAYILAKVISESSLTGIQASFMTKPTNIVIHRKIPQVFSRGRAEAIEAIIHVTRIKVFHEKGLMSEVEDLKKKFSECVSIINRVSVEDSEEVQVVKKLRLMMKEWGVKA